MENINKKKSKKKIYKIPFDLVYSRDKSILGKVLVRHVDSKELFNGEIVQEDGYGFYLLTKSSLLNGGHSTFGTKFTNSWSLGSRDDEERFTLYSYKKQETGEDIKDGYIQLSKKAKEKIRETNDGDTIKEYHTKIPLVFHRKKKESLSRTDFFGIELEYNYLQNDDKFLDYAEKNTSFFHYERDGSLDDGVECISQPFSELYYHSVGKGEIRKLLKNIPYDVNGDVTVDGGTGFHVHISRASINEEIICKLYYLLNEDSWRKEIVLLSGRDQNRYCEYKKGCKVKKYRDTPRSDRYMALNLSNKKTIEVRIFKSSTCETEILGRIEFVMCAINYLRLSTGRYWNSVSLEKFIKFARLYKDEYENLWELLVQNNLDSFKDPKISLQKKRIFKFLRLTKVPGYLPTIIAGDRFFLHEIVSSNIPSGFHLPTKEEIMYIIENYTKEEIASVKKLIPNGYSEGIYSSFFYTLQGYCKIDTDGDVFYNHHTYENDNDLFFHTLLIKNY